MSIVHVQHPVPYRMIPERSRNERLMYVRHTTPVELREVDRGDFDLVMVHKGFRYEAELPIHAHEGGLWRPIGVARAREDGGLPVTARSFAAFLGGEADVPLKNWANDSLSQHLLGTPLVARPGGGHIKRGDPVDLGRARAVRHDGLARARADLHRFFAENLRVHEDRVFLRMQGPLVFGGPSWGGPFFDDTLLMVLDGRQTMDHRVGWAVPMPLHRYAELWELLRDAGILVARDPGRRAPLPVEIFDFKADPVLGLLKGLDPAMVGDADLPVMANEAIRRCVAYCGDLRWDRHSAVAEAAARLEPWEGLAALGAIRPEEAEAAFVVARDVLHAAWAGRRKFLPQHTLLLRYVADVALPRLQAPLALAEDDEAWQGLALGGPR